MVIWEKWGKIVVEFLEVRCWGYVGWRWYEIFEIHIWIGEIYGYCDLNEQKGMKHDESIWSAMQTAKLRQI